VSPVKFNIWLRQTARPALAMGVLNVTPDSFSDAGRFSQAEAAISHAQAMISAGADWIDVGGESTRPGALPVPVDEQIRRTIPVIKTLRRQFDIVISIDTTRSEVAQAALDGGAIVVNDISAGRDDAAMLPLIAGRGAAVILMHMLGSPATMQDAPSYIDVTREVSDFLVARRQAAIDAGIDPSRILLDPGIGFGKTLSHNLQLLRDTTVLAGLGAPLVVGPSRKSFIAKVTGEEPADQRLFGTAAAVAWCVANQAAVVRVHDVEPMARVVRMTRAIACGEI
jgi:dihydropteroate synthase